MVIFRKAIEQDYEGVLMLKKQVHNIHVESEPKFYRISENPFAKSEFLDELEKEHIFILENERKEIIAYAALVEMNVKDNPLIYDQRIMFIDDICVREDERKKGYGKGFFKQLEQMGKEKGYTSLELNVWNFNERGKAFFQKMGMKNMRIRMQKEID